MHDDRIVSFNLGAKRLRESRALLSRLALWDSAELEGPGPVRGLCSVRLAAVDPRLPELVEALRGLGHPEFPRAERIYSKAELATFPWLHLRVTTTGLLGGANLEQPYDYSDACSTCGAGSCPIPPLRIDAKRMGRKLLDVTAHDGQIVVARSLASTLKSAGLTGFEVHPVVHSTGKTADAFVWLRVTSQWQAFEPTSVVTTGDPCPECHRAGHYDSWAEPTELRYSVPPTVPCDLGQTYEYFGVWRMQDQRKPVGGHRAILISQAFRRALIGAKVRHLQFDPVVLAA